MLWQWATERNNWITAEYIQGTLNTEADQLSRTFNDRTEWSLNDNMFSKICNEFGIMPDIDLFVARNNAKLDCFMSFFPDPDAYATDAFNWKSNEFNTEYAFPPFSLLPQVLKKVAVEQVSALIIAPNWPTAPWYHNLMAMVVAPIRLLPSHKSTLFLPHDPSKKHPLLPKLQIMGALIPGKPSNVSLYQNQLKRRYCSPSEQPHASNTRATWRNGSPFVHKKTLIPFIHLKRI